MVLKKGKVVESGTHESLISADGVYTGLVNAQALSSGDCSEEDIYDGLDTEDIDTLSREKSHAVSEYGDHLQYDKHKSGKGRDFFGSFGRLFFDSKTSWGLMIFSFIASMAAGTAQPLYAWMFSISIDLFKYQDDHSKLMDKVDFLGIMWTAFAASAAIAYYFTFISSGRVASFIRAKYQTQCFSSLIFQRAAYFDEDGHSHGTLVSRVRDDPLKLEEIMGTSIAQVCIAVFNVIGGLVMALVSMAAVIPVCVFSGYLRFRYGR